MVSFSGKDLDLFFLPGFRAKTESAANSLLRSFCVRSLEDFVGDLPDEPLLCPVRALRCYLRYASSLVPRPRALFVSPGRPSHALSKNALDAMSYFLREVISQAFVSGSVPGPLVRCRAHGIPGIPVFLRNVPVASILGAAMWRSTVFTSFYLRDLQFSYEGGFSLGPFVASGSVFSSVFYLLFTMYLSIFIFPFPHVFSFVLFPLRAVLLYALYCVCFFAFFLYLMKACADLAREGSPA